ncbi:hypothetical protein E4T38_08613 [Aureobasidium subglaciale]|nr:hypothetical protein E4T38_08613 [Aureobasidium subglaciale]KAI5215038.1 hypothetical protein E4T40_08626 [Aureobasidium subglaciale]KAI5218197.1 hypothetical protein E4T41_08480 [Aureobasidium subglaciale]KAI5255886.1 hypothetical protein E4T46_08514 [Aureobasidium subglaciale]
MSSASMVTGLLISRHQSTRLTYQKLDIQSDALARGLERQGVQKGDRVAVMLGNGVEYCVVRTTERIGETFLTS